MSVLKKRVDALESKVAADEVEPVENPKPCGILLEWPPEDFVGWFDHLLCPTSEWHKLGGKEKLLVVDEFCYATYCELTRHEYLIEPLLECLIEVSRFLRRVNRLEGEEYDRVWEEGFEGLRGSVDKRG